MESEFTPISYIGKRIKHKLRTLVSKTLEKQKNVPNQNKIRISNRGVKLFTSTINSIKG